MKQIITSILDSDLYKITQQQAVFHQYFNAHGRYQFVCRNKGVKFTDAMVNDIRFQLEAMRNVRLTEADYLESLGFFKADYLEWLGEYRFDPRELTVICEDGELEIYAEGRWASAILWEVPLLAIVNEVYFQHTTDFIKLRQAGRERLNAKIEMIQEANDEVGSNFIVVEFGTRRRYSKEWQEEVTRELAKAGAIVGTSNVRLAKILGIKAIGTMAHEFLCGHLGLVDNIAEAQKSALYAWLQEYDDDLGIALTDSFTSDAFFRDFGVVLTKEFEGLRHDSGCPFEFGDKAIAHYESMGVDPMTKTIVFSDGLTVSEALKIKEYFYGRIKVSAYGIGTHLTNDLGVPALNIVMKLVGMRKTKDAPEVPIIKLSDVKGKNMGNPQMIEVVKKAYKVPTEPKQGGIKNIKYDLGNLAGPKLTV